MRTSYKGGLTVFLALTMLLFLTFCLVLVEGTRIYYLRAKAEQAMELSGFSALSEYQYELFSHYGVFFLDLDYEQGREYTAVLEQRMKKYLSENAGELSTTNLETGKFRRGTDSGGLPFFRQAVEQMKVKSGYKIFEELAKEVGSLTEDPVDLEEILSENENAADSILGEYVDENGIPMFQISLPDVSFPTINVLTEAVFGSTAGLSQKAIDPSERISKRNLEEGIGIKENIGLADMQLFHTYLFEHCNYYNSGNPDVWKETLEYQLEYVISGKASDMENLENIMWRIFLLRAGGNYLFYHQDSERMAMAEAEAIALAGITGNEGLIRLVKEILLILQAIEDGISETKRVFEGDKVPLYQNGIFSGLSFGYEEYLFLFLNMTGETEKIYRCMDIVELEVRKKSGYESFRLDHCTDLFEVQWSYQFESLFEMIPFLDSGIYKNTITRKIYYEM